MAILAALLLVLLAFGFRLGIIRKRQNTTLNRLNKAKDHLLSVVSHDFKTSVNSQNLMLDVMNKRLDQMTKEQVKEKIVILKTSSDALKEKMANLFEWMKVELGNGEDNKTAFEVRTLVEECIKAHEIEIEQKDIEVEVDIPEDLLAMDNKNMVKLVLQNLLGNAVKFSWPRSKVRVSAKPENDRIWMFVEDHGTGISPDRKAVLMKDVVSPMKGTKDESGTGIGLVLCSQLLERNGGQIEMESEESLGTTVRFTVESLKN